MKKNIYVGMVESGLRRFAADEKNESSNLSPHLSLYGVVEQSGLLAGLLVPESR